MAREALLGGIGHLRPIARTVADCALLDQIHVGRVLRLTLLAPDIVEAILGGRQSTEITLAMLMTPFAVVWTAQVRELCR